MTNHIKCLMAVALLSLSTLTACGNEIITDELTFERLCEISGGHCDDCEKTTVCKCNDGDCPPGVVCGPDGKCIISNKEDEVNECENGDTKCVDTDGVGKITYCSNGKWAENLSQPCDLSAPCSDDKKGCKECGANVSKCESQTSYKKCKNNKWDDVQTCPTQTPICTSDGCSEFCIDNTKLCFDDKLHTCKEGHWNEPEPCQNGCLSDQTACAECRIDQRSCTTEGNVQYCKNGIWDTENCSNGCSNGSCNDKPIQGCEDDSMICDGGMLKICKDNNYVTISEKDQKICIDTKEGTKIYSCPDQNRNTPEYQNCDIDSCNANKTGCGECKNGETLCKDGFISKCQDGAWGDEQSCPNGSKCDTEGENCIEPP